MALSTVCESFLNYYSSYGTKKTPLSISPEEFQKTILEFSQKNYVSVKPKRGTPFCLGDVACES